MMRDADSLLSTAFIMGAVSIVVYFCLIRPLARGGGTARAGNAATQTAAAAAAPRPASTTSTKKAIKCTRTPPHCSEPSAQIAVNGGSNLLIDGLLAFRHGRAAVCEKQLAADEQACNRKDRALILSRLLEDGNNTKTATTPPAKGVVIVVSIPLEDVGCPKLARVLYLLASYYNLLVLVVVPTEFSKEDRLNLLLKLRGTDGLLTSDVLPDHRIVPSSTVTGRVAFVRQVSRIELVLDFDPEVKDLLSRFGHRVIVYDGQDAAGTGTSRLGSQLLP